MTYDIELKYALGGIRLSYTASVEEFTDHFGRVEPEITEIKDVAINGIELGDAADLQDIYVRDGQEFIDLYDRLADHAVEIWHMESSFIKEGAYA